MPDEINIDNKLPYLVQSSIRSALVDSFNQMMLLTIGSVVIVTFSIFVMTLSWIVLPIFFAAAWLLQYYIRAILNRQIEVRHDGVFYREAYRKQSFGWDEIESLLYEPHKGQITFRIAGKKRRIHEFGLPFEERRIAVLLMMQKAHDERIEVLWRG